MLFRSWVSSYFAKNGDFTYGVYRQKRAWVKSEATWNIYSTGNNWSAGGGAGSSDCETSAIGTVLIPSTAKKNDEITWSLSPTTKSGLDLGYGWLIRPVTDDWYTWIGFKSSDHPDSSYRPKLSVTYTAGGLLQVNTNAQMQSLTGGMRG